MPLQNRVRPSVFYRKQYSCRSGLLVEVYFLHGLRFGWFVFGLEALVDFVAAELFAFVLSLSLSATLRITHEMKYHLTKLSPIRPFVDRSARPTGTGRTGPIIEHAGRETLSYPPAQHSGVQEATLCFPIRADDVLLIEKKRGLGAGRIHGPGGKLEPGETPREAVLREVHEEVAAAVPTVRKFGELEFVMEGVDHMLVHVYRAPGLDGEPRETEEAIPRWYRLDSIPFDRMWPDDRYWLPLVLESRPFRGFFRFGESEDLMRWELETGVSFP